MQQTLKIAQTGFGCIPALPLMLMLKYSARATSGTTPPQSAQVASPSADELARQNELPGIALPNDAKFSKNGKNTRVS
jgi:hypothetical protein